MRESKTSTPSQPLVNEVTNQNESRAFSLDEHRMRMDLIWADYAEYLQILDDIEKRVQALEEKGTNTRAGGNPRRERRTERL